MLQIIVNQSADSGKSYDSQAEYHGDEQQKAGIWGGERARLLGLLPHQESLEIHLRQRMGELLQPGYNMLIYVVTGTRRCRFMTHVVAVRAW